MVRSSLLALSLWLASTSLSNAMTMNAVADDVRRNLHVTLSGSIVRGDAQQFTALIEPYLRRGYLLHQVNVYTPGGLTSEAVAIGDKVAALRARTRGPFVASAGSHTTECWLPRASVTTV